MIDKVANEIYILSFWDGFDGGYQAECAYLNLETAQQSLSKKFPDYEFKIRIVDLNIQGGPCRFYLDSNMPGFGSDWRLEKVQLVKYEY